MARRKRAGSPWPGRILGLVLMAWLAWEILLVVERHYPLQFWATVIVVGVLALLAAVVWIRVRRRERAWRHRMDSDFAVIDRMSGTEFEECVARLLRRSGFQKVAVSGGSGDLGADIVAYLPDRRRVVVQCKRYRGSVGSPPIQALNGTAKDIHGADVTLLVTSGTFTDPARELGERFGIVLVDRDALATWLLDGTPPTLPPPPEPAVPAKSSRFSRPARRPADPLPSSTAPPAAPTPVPTPTPINPLASAEPETSTPAAPPAPVEAPAPTPPRVRQVGRRSAFPPRRAG